MIGLTSPSEVRVIYTSLIGVTSTRPLYLIKTSILKTPSSYHSFWKEMIYKSPETESGKNDVIILWCQTQ